MVRQILPDIEISGKVGTCWTCYRATRPCDGGLPSCKSCLKNCVKCEGYGVLLQRPNSAYGTGEKACTKERLATSASILKYMSPFALLPMDKALLYHYLQHVSSVALAVDYTENGYRMLTPMATEEPALLDAMLAVAAAHRSKWQHVEDTDSWKYLRKALVRLQEILNDPEAATKESTLGIILCLLSYEVFNGTGRWKQHFGGIEGWIKLKGDCSNLNPFLKTWITMIDTQAAMNLGQVGIPEVEEWLSISESQRGDSPTIDPLFGCSTRLPKLMSEAARLYSLSRSVTFNPAGLQRELQAQAESLRLRIIDAALDFESKPALAVSCGQPHLTATAPSRTYADLARRMWATAEIFRHALLIYVYRVAYGAVVPLDSLTQSSLDEIYKLLPYVPDAFGPGANLGWALVITAAETDNPELRQYIRCRWRGLKLLEMNNNKSGEKLTEEVWRRRDASESHRGVHWQDVMRDLGGEQILV